MDWAGVEQVQALRTVEKHLGLEKLYVLGTNCVDNGPRQGLDKFLRAASQEPETVLHYEFMQVRSCPWLPAFCCISADLQSPCRHRCAASIQLTCSRSASQQSRALGFARLHMNGHLDLAMKCVVLLTTSLPCSLGCDKASAYAAWWAAGLSRAPEAHGRELREDTILLPSIQ